MFKSAELTIIEKQTSVSVEYDKNNDIYLLTLIEYEEGITIGDETTHEIKNASTVQIEKKDVKQIIKMLEFVTSNDEYIDNYLD